MGLVLLFGVLMVVSIVLHYLTNEDIIGHWYDFSNTLTFIAQVVFTTVFVAIVVIGTTFYTGLKMSYDANQVKYDSLMFKLESIEEVTDVLEIRNLDIINEVEEWNTTLATVKQANKSKMIGMFVPDECENFKFIDLKINS